MRGTIVPALGYKNGDRRNPQLRRAVIRLSRFDNRTVGRDVMKKVLIITVAAFALAGCQTVQQDRALTGAAIGGVAGTAIGAAAGGSVGSAVAGGLIGATAGGVIGAATTPQTCYVRTRSGYNKRVAC
jgi:uncharacterized protein YcfJ